MTQEEVRTWLLTMAEEGYQKFSSGLIPGADHILGIRLPVLRKMAKQLAGEDWKGCMAWKDTVYFEEVMLQAMTLGYAKAEIGELLEEFAAFIPKVDNWSVNDTLCMSFKAAKKEQEAVWDFLMKYRDSREIYEVRVVAVMLLSHFLNETYIDRVLSVLGSLSIEGYYASMGIAWAYATAWAKFPEKTREYLSAHPIEPDTYWKTLQKCMESYRVSEEEKAWIRNERVRLKSGI